MMLLEHDAKQLARSRGLPVPDGVLFDRNGQSAQAEMPTAPWMVKAQVPVGGRGKAGGIVAAESLDDVQRIIRELKDKRIQGHEINSYRVEACVEAAHEVYVSLSIDAAARGIRVLVVEQGGVDVETAARQDDGLKSLVVSPTIAALEAAILQMTDPLPEHLRDAVRAAAKPLAALFVESEAMLLEVNPLFVLSDGSWLLGDLKLAIDPSALERQPDLLKIVEARPDAYREQIFKLAEGFDFIELDRDGEIGLLTTGAGLSMMLIDELLGAGRHPFNFCDIRSGQFRGSPARLVTMLRRFAQAPNISSVLVNIFAGITDLADFARLLIEALGQVPEFKAPLVARLIGNNFEEAKVLIAQSGYDIVVEEDLDRALAIAGAGREARHVS